MQLWARQPVYGSGKKCERGGGAALEEKARGASTRVFLESCSVPDTDILPKIAMIGRQDTGARVCCAVEPVATSMLRRRRETAAGPAAARAPPRPNMIYTSSNTTSLTFWELKGTFTTGLVRLSALRRARPLPRRHKLAWHPIAMGARHTLALGADQP